MDDAKVFLECHRAHRRGHQHFAAGVQVVAVAISARQSVCDEADAFERDAIAHRVERRAGKALDAVRERIRAGGGGEFGWQTPREFGVKDDEPGEQFRMENHRLALGGSERDD